MSWQATSWAAGVRNISASEFRVLMQLANRHTPDKGCFPEQATLMENCELSSSTLNDVLNRLEAKDLILRVRRHNPKTKKRTSTYYILGFEDFDAQKPTPDIGDGGEPIKKGEKHQKPTPDTGDGANSGFPPEPTPDLPQSQLRPTGDNILRTLKDKKGAREAEREIFTTQHVDTMIAEIDRLKASGNRPTPALRDRDRLAYWAVCIWQGRYVQGYVEKRDAADMLKLGYITEPKLLERNVEYYKPRSDKGAKIA